MRTAGARGHDGTGALREVSEDQLTTVRLCERKPVTVWRVAAALGDDRGERASAILDVLTATGALARFRAGLSDYYAPPREALTGHGPGPAAVLADSVKGLVLTCRSRVTRHRASTTGESMIQSR